jgi:predicted Fe-Mo cluster-binding NifX family protein
MSRNDHRGHRKGGDLEAAVDTRFGRAAAFVVMHTDTGTVRALDNRDASVTGQGAGIQAARLMADQGIHIVLTGYCGPNAYRALRAADIRVYTELVEGTIREAVEQFQAELLHEAAGADVQSH